MYIKIGKYQNTNILYNYIHNNVILVDNIEQSNIEFSYSNDDVNNSNIFNIEPSADKYNTSIENISIILTNFCNMKCIYCTGNIDDKQYLNLDYLKNLLNTLLINNYISNNILHIHFYGGEPLLRYNDLFDILYYLDSFQINTSYTISTNGTLLTKEITEVLKEYNVKIILSIDGNNNTNNLFRKYKGGKIVCYDNIFSIIEEIRILDSSWIKNNILINCVINPYSDIYELDEFFLSKGISNVNYINMTNNGLKKCNIPIEEYCNHYYDVIEGLCDITEYKLSNCKYNDIISDQPFTYTKKYSNLVGPLRKKICSAGRGNIAIGSDGNIYPCYQLISTEHKLSYTEYCNNVLRNKIYSGYYKECNRCWLQYLCPLLCYAAVNSNKYIINRSSCNLQKRLFSLYIKEHIKIKKLYTTEYQEYINYKYNNNAIQ